MPNRQRVVDPSVRPFRRSRCGVYDLAVRQPATDAAAANLNFGKHVKGPTVRVIFDVDDAASPTPVRSIAVSLLAKVSWSRLQSPPVRSLGRHIYRKPVVGPRI